MSESTSSPRDPRLALLFDEEAAVVSRACVELVPIVFDDPELDIPALDKFIKAENGYVREVA